MADRYRIRPARRTDLSEIAAIERAVFTDPWSPAMLRRSIDTLALVTEDVAGAVVGYIFAVAIDHEGEILNLAVHLRHRRRGLARLLSEAIFTQMRRAGVRRVFLEVRASNLGAQRFYDVLGFEQIGRRPGYYRRPREDALILARSLGDETPPHRTGQNRVSLIDKRT
jgi:ribosomal-protein-alanine N-acetyltransferase